MKKWVLLALLLTSVLTVLCLCSAVADTEDDFEIVVLSDGTCRITRYKGTASVLSVPETIRGYKVSSIGDGAFVGNHWLNSLMLPDSVTYIGDNAFTACISLKNVTLPDSLTSIGDMAFIDCTSLSSITLPNSLSEMGATPFSSSTDVRMSADHPAFEIVDGMLFDKKEKKLIGAITAFTAENYTIPQGTQVIGDYAFSNFDSLTSVTLPDSVISIGKGAFFDCDSLTNIILPDSLTTIEDSAFLHCTSLTSIILPDSVISIGDSAFSDCQLLKSVTLSDSLTTIGKSAFYWCLSLKDIALPESLTSIGTSAFENCQSLTSLTLPDSLTYIGKNAFAYCSKLTLSVTKGSYAETHCKGKYLRCETLEDMFEINVLSDDSCEIAKYNGSAEVRSIPEYINGYRVTAIGRSAFSRCYSLTSITLPDSVTSIGDSAFSRCYSLTSITLPDSLTSIGEYAFSECSLTSITLPDSVISIGDSAFFGCSSLTSITLPDSVTSIGEYAFNGCSSLTSITLPDSVTSIGKGAFSRCALLTDVTLPDSVTSIGDSAFQNCGSLTSITLPDSVTSIGDSAFSWCLSLTDVTLPDSLTSIGDSAFQKCGSLTSIILPDSVISIGDSAFFGCSSLTSITLPDSVTSIGDSAFSRCYSLTSITLPDSLNEIGHTPFSSSTDIRISADHPVFELIDGVLFDKKEKRLICYTSSFTAQNYTVPQGTQIIEYGAFSECKSLTSITLPDSLSSIGMYAFSDCSSLTSITLPDSLSSIGMYAFSNCSSITSITLPDSLTTIGKDVFIDCNKLTITVAKKSYAEAYCEENNLNFEALVSSIEDYFEISVLSDGTCEITKYNGSVETLSIPEYIQGYRATSIGKDAFSQCTSLTSVTLPDSVTSIGEYAFSESGLTSITLPDSVTSIGKDAFFWCASLANVTLPDYLTSIGMGAFSWCSSLEDITLPDSVTSIGEYAFNGCSSLTSITLPDSLTTIGEGVFDQCTNLTVTVTEGSYAETYCIENVLNYVYEEDSLSFYAENITGNSEWLLACHQIYKQDVVVGGKKYDQINIKGYADNTFARAYSLLFGDALTAADDKWMQRFAVAEYFMDEFSPKNDTFEMKLEELEAANDLCKTALGFEVFGKIINTLKVINKSEDIPEKYKTLVRTEYLNGKITWKLAFSEESYDKFFDDIDWAGKSQESVFTDTATNTATAVQLAYEAFNKGIKYSKVNKNAIQSVIAGLRQSADEDLLAVADILEEIIADEMGIWCYVWKSAGFGLAQKAISFLRDKGIDGIAGMNPAVALYVGAIKGSTLFNEIAFNTNSINTAIFRMNWLIDMTDKYVPYYERALEAFQANPVSGYQQFAEAAITMTQLIMIEYKGCAEWMSSHDQSLSAQAFWGGAKTGETHQEMTERIQNQINNLLFDDLYWIYYEEKGGLKTRGVSEVRWPFGTDRENLYNLEELYYMD